jgi:hypothetical protein
MAGGFGDDADGEGTWQPRRRWHKGANTRKKRHSAVEAMGCVDEAKNLKVFQEVAQVI